MRNLTPPKDKNGVNVFEGDTVEYQGINYKVIYFKGKFMIVGHLLEDIEFVRVEK